MTTQDLGVGPGPRLFISHAAPEASFAAALADALRASGAEVALKDPGDGAGDAAYLRRLEAALADPGTRVLALITAEYVASDACRAEGLAALDGDRMNRRERLVPLLAGPTAPDGLFTPISYVSIVRERRDGDVAAAIAKALAACGLATAPPAAREAALEFLHPEIRKESGFLGRAAELTEVAARLAADGVAVIAGPPGVGASSLAREAAWRSRGRYRGVWRIDAADREALRAGLASFAARIAPDAPRTEQTDAEMARAAAVIAETGAERPWLLLLDDAADPAAAELAPKEGAHLLIAANRQDWSGAPAPIALGPLARAEAVELLCAEAGREDRAGAEALAATLGDLPLALTLAARYCREIRTARFGDCAVVETRPDAIYAELGARSLAAIAAEQPDAARLFERSKAVAQTPVPLETLAEDAAMEDDAVAAAAALLDRYALARLRVLPNGRPALDIHAALRMSQDAAPPAPVERTAPAEAAPEPPSGPELLEPEPEPASRPRLQDNKDGAQPRGFWARLFGRRRAS